MADLRHLMSRHESKESKHCPNHLDNAVEEAGLQILLGILPKMKNQSVYLLYHTVYAEHHFLRLIHLCIHSLSYSNSDVHDVSSCCEIFVSSST